MMEYLEKKIKYFEKNTTKIYLILANIILVIFSIWLTNVGVLPFKNAGDFAFFTLLWLLLALYRPGWAFTLFIGALALENINLAPASFGIVIRPYQLLVFVIILAIITRFLLKKMAFSLPKLIWIDTLPLLFIVASFLSAIFSTNKSISFKQSVIAATFVMIYFLVRIFIQSFDDLKRVTPFFLSSAVVISLYAILQNVRFNKGLNPFEIMPGRPNATFTEPDWLGIYLVFVLAIIFTIIYKLIISNKQGTIIKQISNYILIALVLIALILTVSRSAWMGAVFVVVVFLKLVLVGGTFKIFEFKWKAMFWEFKNIVTVLAISFAIIYSFGLTKFNLGSRAISTAGLQEITIACDTGKLSSQNVRELSSQSVIVNLEDLKKFGCRYINLEDIEKEKAAGNIVSKINRPDPNIGIRSRIYLIAIAQIKQHPIFGIGWGSISKILGIDNRGAGFNASNIFLEVWLGSGIVGILSFIFLLTYIFCKGVALFFKRSDDLKIISVFVLLALVSLVIPNLFNSGIFLGFFWVYMAIAISLLESNPASTIINKK